MKGTSPHHPHRPLCLKDKKKKGFRDIVVVFVSPLQISILSVADTVRSCSLDQCYKSLLSPATSETKRKMSTFISNIKASDAATHHAAGFQKAFQLIRNTTSLSKQSTSKTKKYIFNLGCLYLYI